MRPQKAQRRPNGLRARFRPSTGIERQEDQDEGLRPAKAVLLVQCRVVLRLQRPSTGELQKLHETYGAKGLVVLGVPSNDFGAAGTQVGSRDPEILRDLVSASPSR